MQFIRGGKVSRMEKQEVIFVFHRVVKTIDTSFIWLYKNLSEQKCFTRKVSRLPLNLRNFSTLNELHYTVLKKYEAIKITHILLIYIQNVQWVIFRRKIWHFNDICKLLTLKFSVTHLQLIQHYRRFTFTSKYLMWVHSQKLLSLK